VVEKFQKSMDGKSAELADALKRYAYGSMQQYRTRYLLAKLTQHVEMAFKGMNAPGPLGDYMTLEIEHILPNNPEPELRASFESASPGRKYDDYKARLGNLTLLKSPSISLPAMGSSPAKRLNMRSLAITLRAASPG
jgi:hypothetical protein